MLNQNLVLPLTSYVTLDSQSVQVKDTSAPVSLEMITATYKD